MVTPQPIPRNPRFQDLTGRRFNRWTVLFYAGERNWWCRCDCGTEKEVQANNLRSGKTRSCNCLKDEETIRRETTHGMGRTPEYHSWQQMKDRCGNPKKACYFRYGGRGIRVCPEWQDSFETFFAHVGPKPSPAHTIGRIDNEKGYEPGNVRWETIGQQSINKRNNRLVTFCGETLPLCEWCRRVGLKYHTVCGRLRRGWSVEEALSLPLSFNGRHPTYLVNPAFSPAINVPGDAPG